MVFDLLDSAGAADDDVVLYIQQALDHPDRPRRMEVRKITYAGETYIFTETGEGSNDE